MVQQGPSVNAQWPSLYNHSSVRSASFMPQEDARIAAPPADRANHDRPSNDRSSNDRPNDERYDPQRVEMKWTERWQADATLYAAERNSAKKKY